MNEQVFVDSVEILPANERRDAIAKVQLKGLMNQERATIFTFNVDVATAIEKTWIAGSIERGEVKEGWKYKVKRWDEKTGKHVEKEETFSMKGFFKRPGQTIEQAAEEAGQELKVKAKVAQEAAAAVDLKD